MGLEPRLGIDDGFTVEHYVVERACDRALDGHDGLLPWNSGFEVKVGKPVAGKANGKETSRRRGNAERPTNISLL